VTTRVRNLRQVAARFISSTRHFPPITWQAFNSHANNIYIFVASCTLCTGAARGREAPPPRNWVHKKIPGCVVELNTQNCAWFGSQISLITAMSFREAMPPRTTHQELCPWTPLGDFRSPDLLCPPPHLQILATPLTL